MKHKCTQKQQSPNMAKSFNSIIVSFENFDPTPPITPIGIYQTRHVFVKHGCPRRQQSQTMAKISKSYILTLPHPQGHVMSVKCEQPLDELTVQVWLLHDHPHFEYCTLFISGTELRTDGQTDGRTDDPNTRCPRRTFEAGGIKIRRNTFRYSIFSI